MSRNLLSAFIAVFIGAIWLGYHEYGKLNDQLSDLAARVAQIEQPPADDREADLERLQNLESAITGLQAPPTTNNTPTTTNTTENSEAARPQTKPILVRKFTNRATSKTIDARLVAVAGTDVTIRRIDGKEFTFPIARLTRDDQIYIAEHADAIKPVSSQDANPAPSSGQDTFDFDKLFNEDSQ